MNLTNQMKMKLISLWTQSPLEGEIDSQEVKFKEEIKKLAKEIYLESIDE